MFKLFDEEVYLLNQWSGRPKLCCCEEEEPKVVKEDRISALNNDIIFHILSFLRTDEAVRTGVLSKRWLYLWTLLPSLHFDNQKGRYTDDDYCGGHNDDDEHIEKFCVFVEKALLLHNCSKLKRFQFYLDSERPRDLSLVFDKWIRFASLRNVEELVVCTYVESYTGRFYKLPRFLYACSTLTKLKLAFCDLTWGGQIKWTHLKDLTLKSCDLCAEFFSSLFPQTPVLECLYLFSCRNLTDLNIAFPALKMLVICNDLPMDETRPLLKIEAPYLQSLQIVWFMSKGIQLRNLSSLTHAQFEFELVDESDDQRNEEEDKKMFREMLRQVHNVTKLSLGPWHISCVPELNGTEISMPSFKCKRLILKTNRIFGDLPKIATLLHCSHELEELTLELDRDAYACDDGAAEKTYWTSCNMTFTCLVSHLKTISIVHESPPSIKQPSLPLLRFLLKEACVLENVIVKKKWPKYLVISDDELSREHDWTKKLLSLPRASPYVAIKLP